MYKVFIQNNSITFLESSKNINFTKFHLSETTATCDKVKILSDLNHSENKSDYFIYCNNPSSCFDFFFNNYEKITASGGIVQCGEMCAIIQRHSVWDLPKGKVELDESIENAVIREIEEETGLRNLSIQRKLIETYHTYSIYGPNTLKKTVWFLLNTTSIQEGTPQKEEAITAVKWVPKKDILSYFENSYLNLKEVVLAFLSN